MDEPEGDEVHVSFMQKCGKTLYKWPTTPDESWEPLDSVVCSVGYPQLANNREQFAFPEESFKKINTCVKNTYHLK